MYIETTEKLLDFIEKSPTAFQAVDEMQKRLTENGFEVLSEKEYWKLVPGGKYLVTRNNSALIAFCIPEKESRVFHIMASHSDSPSFKIKENPEIEVEKLKKAEYMSYHIGEEFEGIISGVTGWGFYVELPNTVEGLVHVNTLRDDYYTFDQDAYELIGDVTHKVFALGQKVRVRVADADTMLKTVDFVLAEEQEW